MDVSQPMRWIILRQTANLKGSLFMKCVPAEDFILQAP